MPTAMSNVSASAGSEIALFSGVSDSDGLSISGNGDTANMELKVTNENGKTKKVSDFQMNADNVLYIKVGDKVTVNDNVDFTKAIATDGNNNQKAIGITSNGVIDFTGYAQGVSTLDVVVDDDKAYEAIIAIGDQTNQIVDKEITRVNSDYTLRLVYPLIEDPKPPKDIGLPYCDLVSDDYKGGCSDRKDGDDINGYPCRDGSNVKDWRDCKDAGKHPDEVKRTMPKPEPEPEPPVDSCGCPIAEGIDCPQMVCESPIETEPEPKLSEELTANCGGEPCIQQRRKIHG